MTESSEFLKKIKQSKDYRSFLKIYLQEKSLSYSDFARATGFTRGFPADVISGKRRLTAKSAYAFEGALKLPHFGKKFFRLLVAHEEKDTFPEIPRNNIDKEIELLRTNSWYKDRRQIKDFVTPVAKTLLADSRVLSIYSASGTPDSGATLEEITQRTRFLRQDLDHNIENLLAAGLLKKIEGRFYPQNLHLFLETHEINKLLTSVFQKACRFASERIEKTAQNSPEMFFASNFCIKESSLPELKKELKETILKFVDSSISSDGDRVVKLITALHF